MEKGKKNERKKSDWGGANVSTSTACDQDGCVRVEVVGAEVAPKQQVGREEKNKLKKNRSNWSDATAN